jgi:hypothetical protein
MGGKINDLMQIVSTSPSLNVGDYGIFILFKLPMENKICADTDNKYLLTKGKNCYVLIEKDSCKIETLEGSLVNDEKINCIEEITGKTIKYNKQEIMLKSTAANHSISGFSPKEITAGTGEVLRIFGSGFGNTQGTSTVWFRYADNPNQIFTSSNGFKVSLWSDEEIQIVVPSKAATGNIFVNINDVKAESTEELKVKFNVQQEYYKPQYLINTNEKGGYTFHFHSNINKFVGAKEQIEKSINEWICSTSVPWEIGNSQSVEPGMDGICSVQFGDLSDGGGETLGRASIILQETSFLNSNDYVLKEVDVIFSQKENWCFNNSKITDQQIDFLSVALHEFGHAHLL